MPRAAPITPAQHSRDLALARVRKLSAGAALGAAGLTVAAALIAANTLPGRALGSDQGATSPGGSSGSVPTDAGGQPLAAPGQAPQAVAGGGPAVVSGSS